MTYCLAMCLNDGLVFSSDSLTNSGVDYVRTYSKLHIFTPAPDRMYMLLSSGNLATTQEVLYRIQRDLDKDDDTPNLGNVDYLFEAADYIGRVSSDVQREHAAALKQGGISGDGTFIVGGQIAGKPHGLFRIYPQGNFISASAETPYLQIGENKYGKPVLDRVINAGLCLEDGARLALVSQNATSRSNISVGPPFELAIYKKDSLKIANHMRLAIESPYYQALSQAWQTGLVKTFMSLPRFDWEDRPD